MLGGRRNMVEWVKGTGLQPFEGEVWEAYLAAYKRRLGEAYPRRANGNVMLRYPKLFVVAGEVDLEDSVCCCGNYGGPESKVRRHILATVKEQCSVSSMG